MIPRWMIQLVRRLVIGPHDTADVTFVSSSLDLWDNFVESSAVKKLLSSDDGDLKPVSDWQQELRTAFRLCRDLDLEDRLDMEKIHPILSRLIVGTYFAEHNLSLPSDQDSSSFDNKFLLHAVIGIKLSRSCPPCIFSWIVETHPEQLHSTDPINNSQLPLAATCSSPQSTPDRMLTILFAYLHAASVPDSQGRYPLELACCESGCFTWETGIRQLFQAAPDVLGIRSAVDGRSLFVSTALAQAEKTCGEEHTNTLFELLRNDPTVVRDFLVGE